MLEHPDPLGPPSAVWTASTVARRLGVAPATLRSWARRYGIGPAGHAPGRHRRYTDADIAELDAMRALVDQGMVLPVAAAIVRSQSDHPHGLNSDPTSPDPGPPAPYSRAPAEAVGDLVAAAAQLDLDAAIAILTAALAAHGVVTTWEQLCRRTLRDLDATAATDRGCADAQLLLSWAIGTCLRRPATVPPGSEARPVLLACPAGEQHTLALDALFAALHQHRVPARMLGPAVPSVALRHAAAHLRPAAVVVWAQRAQTARPDILRRVLPHACVVLAAGPGWRQTAVPSTVIKVDSLPIALDLLAPRSRPDGHHRDDAQPFTAAPA